MIKKLFSKKTNTTKHNANRNFCKKSLCKRSADASLHQVKNGKLPYFKIGSLFIVCLALGIALTACAYNNSADNAPNIPTEKEPSYVLPHKFHGTPREKLLCHQPHDLQASRYEYPYDPPAEKSPAEKEPTDNDSLPPLIAYTLKTGDAAKFISKWKTDIVDHGPSGTSNRVIELPLVENGRYDFTVNWGDGTSSTITSWDAAEKIHTYFRPGVYTVTITGTIVGWASHYHTDEEGKKSHNPYSTKLIEVSQWGNLHLGNTTGYQFYAAVNLNITATDAPFLHDGRSTYTTDLSCAFAVALNLKDRSDNLSNWDVSHVETMKGMFFKAKSFNEPIGNWEVGNVTNMQNMFHTAHVFNKPIGDWDVSKVTTMNAMFLGANHFNQPIGDWEVGNVTNMSSMFGSADRFNQPIGDWDVSSVIDMYSMFYVAHGFRQEDISKWNVSNVQIVSWMFFETGSVPVLITRKDSYELEYPPPIEGHVWCSGPDETTGCPSEGAFLKTILRKHTFDPDLSRWDLSSVSQFESDWCIHGFMIPVPGIKLCSYDEGDFPGAEPKPSPYPEPAPQ